MSRSRQRKGATRLRTMMTRKKRRTDSRLMAGDVTKQEKAKHTGKAKGKGKSVAKPKAKAKGKRGAKGKKAEKEEGEQADLFF